MNLEEGKTYLMRNGNITKPLRKKVVQYTEFNELSVFTDDEHSWDVNGDEFPFDSTLGEESFEIVHEYSEHMQDTSITRGMPAAFEKSFEVYTKSTSLTDNLTPDHLQALDEMLIKLYKHEITDWTFRMFLEGMISNLKLHF